MSHASWRVKDRYLHGVDCDINTAVEQSLVDLLGEKALAADVCEGLVENLIARRLDNDNLECTLLLELGEASLKKKSKLMNARGLLGTVCLPGSHLPSANL